jgi:hypothetical protein
MKKSYLYLMACAMGAMSLTSCSEDSTPAGGGGDSTIEVPLAQVSKPKPNPWLAQEEYSITHFNSAQTDAFSYEVKDGTFNIDLSKCQMTWSGPVNLMTLASTSPKYMWGMSSDRVSYLDISDGKLERVAEAGLPGITMKTQEQLTNMTADYVTYDELSKTITDILGPAPQMSMANGNYVLCDKDNYAYTNAGQVMVRYRLANPNNPKEGIVLDHQIRLTDFTFNSFTLVGATMTYDGHLVVAAQNGILVLNRALTTIEDSYALPSDQILTNSICIDENGGLYVASNSRTPGGKGLMQKLICKDGKFSTSPADGAWQAYYDGGPKAPCIKLGYGTGSTPTLMGFGQDEDKLVVITDGSKRMKLVAFWRDEIPLGAQQVAGYDKRIAGVHEVTCGLPASTEWIQSEQSVVVGGYDAFVVNNINVTDQEINDKIIGVIAIGPIVKGPQGTECVRWNTKENKWESKWARSDVSSVSMIPAVSTKSEMVFVCGWNDASGWEVTGLDWKSGATRHRTILGKSNRANGAYAIIQYLANGDLLFNSVAGPIRIKY